MRRIAWAITIVAVLAAGGFAVFRDPGRIHIYDAAGAVLAETQAEGFCSGSTFWATRGNGDSHVAAKCRTDTVYGTTIDHNNVQWYFCLGAQSAGFTGDLNADCLNFLQGSKFWPTADGQITNTWSDTYPYPLDQFGTTDGQETEDRGHDRSGFNRGEN